MVAQTNITRRNPDQPSSTTPPAPPVRAAAASGRRPPNNSPRVSGNNNLGGLPLSPIVTSDDPGHRGQRGVSNSRPG